jgi:hypothetical protein
MSFDKDYPKRKDHRQPYQKRCEQVDVSCRPGGSCPYCRSNRQFRTQKRIPYTEKNEC